MPDTASKPDIIDLIKSNLVTLDITEIADEHGLLQGEIKLKIKDWQEYFTSFETIVSKMKNDGFDSLTTYEIHALTDKLEDLYKDNSKFTKLVDKYIKNNSSQIRNIYGYCKYLRNQAQPYLSKNNLTIKDHAFMRMLDRNCAVIFDDSQSRYLSTGELFERIISAAKKGEEEITIGSSNIRLILNGNSIDTIILE